MYSNDGAVIYADCFCCGGRRKLGIYLSNKVAVCGRCKDGGHGGDVWNGVAGLPKLIKLIEGCTWHDAFKIIETTVGFEPTIKPKIQTEAYNPKLPKECIPLAKCLEQDPAVKFLNERHVGHLRESSHVCVLGKYKNRVVIPTYYGEEFTGFEAKGVYKSMYPKSLYPAGMATHKLFYTATNWDRDRKIVAITESVIDAETFHTLDVNAIGCFGAFKPSHINALLDLGNVEQLYWFLDGDAWGKLQGNIQQTASLFRNFVFPIKDKEDPNSLGPVKLRKLLENPREIRSAWDFNEFAFEMGRL